MLQKTRLMRLRETMQASQLEALLIEDTTSLFYLTGMQFSLGQLLVTQDAAQLIVDGRYYEAAVTRWPFEVILAEEKALDTALKELHVHSLAFCSSETSYDRFKQLERVCDERVNGAPIELKGVDHPVKQLRLMKEEGELEKLREAAHLGSKGYDRVCSLLVEGVSERELALELEIFWRRHGGDKLAFDPIIAFATNTSMPHYHPGPDQLKAGSPVLIDIGVTLDHYHSDMTRTVFFGDPDPKMVEIYNVVLEAQLKALEHCQPGTTLGELDAVAREHISAAGYGKYFSHSLGHGIGLEVHELPTIRNKGLAKEKTLEAGMVITIEPGVYLPGVGGVRIEDTIVINENGYEDLTIRDKSIKIVK